MVVLRVIQLSVRVARGGVACLIDCPAVCGAAEATVFVDVFTSVSFFNDLVSKIVLKNRAQCVLSVFRSCRAFAQRFGHSAC